MRSRFRVCFSAFLLMVFFHAAPAFCQLAAAGDSQEKSSNTLSVFISDTQSPMMIERLWLKYTENDNATAKLYSAIAAGKKTSAVFHLGDIVAIGSSRNEWKDAESNILKLKVAGLPFYPIPGNHEYMFDPERGMDNFWRVFPDLHGTWYTVRNGQIAVIMLNSNFSELSREELSTQLLWYKEQLGIFDNDPSVHTVIVATHYPPYTNSKIVSESEEVQKAFVPLFQVCGKCRLFLSGHSHAFEHFREQGKDFLVIGGGGGLIHPLRTGNEQKWKDLFPEKTKKRFFHYITCEDMDSGILVSVHRLKPDQSGFDIPYSFTIPTVGK